MRLLYERAPLCDAHLHSGLTDFVETADRQYCLCRDPSAIQIIDRHGIHSRLAPSRPYKKIAWNGNRNLFYGILAHRPDSVYVMDRHLRELDCLRLNLPAPCPGMEDICFDPASDSILLLGKTHIFRFNSNGDGLGTWMSAPKLIQYQSICTYETDRFVSYVKAGCSCIASYTEQGAFLERLCLGSDYSVICLNVVHEDLRPVLQVHAKKDWRYLTTLAIELPEADCAKPLVDLECASEIPGVHSTCFVEEREYY